VAFTKLRLAIRGDDGGCIRCTILKQSTTSNPGRAPRLIDDCRPADEERVILWDGAGRCRGYLQASLFASGVLQPAADYVPRQLIPKHRQTLWSAGKLLAGRQSASHLFLGGLRLFHGDPTLVICPFERTEVRTKYF